MFVPMELIEEMQIVKKRDTTDEQTESAKSVKQFENRRKRSASSIICIGGV